MNPPIFQLSAPPDDIAVPVAAPEAFRLSSPPDDIIVPVVAPISELGAAVGMSPLLALGALSDELPERLRDADNSDVPDSGPIEAISGSAQAAVALSNEEAFRIILEVAQGWSGVDGWTAVAPDLEFTTPGHPSAGQRHFGLGFGLLLATQESGLLGDVLRLFRDRDAGAFEAAFGADGDTLLAVTTAVSAAERLAPVGGSLLWEGDWPARFERAGALAPCQFAQNEVAVERLIRPLAPTAIALGLSTDRTMAMALDRVVAGGFGSGLRALVGTVVPFATAEHRQYALASLDLPDVPALQAARGLQRTGVWDAPTLIGLMTAVRDRARLPLPTAAEAQARLLAAALGPSRRRLLRLRDTSGLDDRALLPA